MIKFVDFGNQISKSDRRSFGFFNTMRNRFVILNNSLYWHSYLELKSDYNAQLMLSTMHVILPKLENFKSLIPDDFKWNPICYGLPLEDKSDLYLKCLINQNPWPPLVKLHKGKYIKKEDMFYPEGLLEGDMFSVLAWSEEL